MTETPLNSQSVEELDEETPTGPQTVYCRHCGQAVERAADADTDWLCSHCERYQDAMTCPTCGGTARISLLAPELAPEAHAPAKRRKVKEGE